MNFESFVEAYTVTALVMFPILVFIIILLVRDLGKYSKLSEKINGVIKNLSEDLNDEGFKRENTESILQRITRYINKKYLFNNVIENHICRQIYHTKVRWTLLYSICVITWRTLHIQISFNYFIRATSIRTCLFERSWTM